MLHQMCWAVGTPPSYRRPDSLGRPVKLVSPSVDGLGRMCAQRATSNERLAGSVSSVPVHDQTCQRYPQEQQQRAEEH